MHSKFAQQQPQHLSSFPDKSPPTSHNTQPSNGGGRCQYDDGGWYSGQWEMGMAHGHGVCGSGQNAREMTEFSGLWQQGFEVNGICKWDSGTTYEGQWLQGKQHGLGVEKKGHWTYKGEWTHGSKGRYGVGQSTASNFRYEGTWTSGVKDGYGVETYPDEGSYHGQWMRGMRHGYGVRQSAPYIVALRCSHSSYPNSMSTPSLDGSDSRYISFDRDSRMEENKGGFVLQARTAPDESQAKPAKRPGLLDRIGKQGLRKSLANEFKRQRSAGDLLNQGRPQSAGGNSRGSSTGGSVRSTTSTFSQISSAFSSSTRRSSDDLLDELGSFCSDIDLANDRVTESYAGEWKNDKRSGYGVCKRSDGVMYEGEWLNNRKHGYGTTTLANGTRLEGKYKSNVLVSALKTSKLFALRSNKIKDKVESSVNSAQKAANMAVQKMETAGVRMTSARVRADQADESARRALGDAELANTMARQYSSDFQGARVIVNRQQEEDRSLDELSSSAYKTGRPNLPGQKYNTLQQQQQEQQHHHQQQQQHTQIYLTEQAPKPQKKFTFFKLKKTDQQWRSKSETAKSPQSSGFSLFGSPVLKANTPVKTRKNEPPVLNTYNQAYESISNSTLSRPNPLTDFGSNNERFHQSSAQSHTLNSPRTDISLLVPHTTNLWSENHVGSPTRNLPAYNRDVVTLSPTVSDDLSHPQLRDSIYNVSSKQRAREVNDPVSLSHLKSHDIRDADKFAQSGNSYNQPRDYHTSFGNSDVMKGSYTVESIQANTIVSALPVVDHFVPVTNQAVVMGGMNHPDLSSRQPIRSNKPFVQQPPIPVNSADADRDYYDHADNSMFETFEPQKDRRKSLPSIIKEPPANSPLNPPNSSATRNIQVATTSPPKTLLGQTSLSFFSSKPAQPHASDHVPTDTYVIENGVRRRIKPTVAAKVTATPAKVPQYELEASKTVYKRGDLGSLPDVSTVSDAEVLPREIVYQMSQRRREELMREREELERRFGGNIVLRFEDIADFFRKKKIFILILFFNVALVYAFLSLLKDK